VQENLDPINENNDNNDNNLDGDNNQDNGNDHNATQEDKFFEAQGSIEEDDGYGTIVYSSTIRFQFQLFFFKKTKNNDNRRRKSSRI